MVVKEMTFTLDEISQIAGQYLQDKHGLYMYETIEPYFIHGKLHFRFSVKENKQFDEINK